MLSSSAVSVALQDLSTQEQTYAFHPVELDACFQALLVLKIAQQAEGAPLSDFQIPTNVGRLRLIGRFTRKLFVHGVLEEETDQGSRGNLFIYNKRGEPHRVQHAKG